MHEGRMNVFFLLFISCLQYANIQLHDERANKRKSEREKGSEEEKDTD